MSEPRTRFLIAALLMMVFALLVGFVVISEQKATIVPATAAAQIRTAAVGTAFADLTRSVPPSITPSATAHASPTLPPPTTSSGTPSCLGLRFVRDVSIPDNTEMSPAEVFTKTWLVENSGTCAWKPGFRVILIGGVAMGGSPFRVAQTVGPGGEIQVSIKMAAPTTQTGTVQGTWQMTDTDGVGFGEALWVVIDIAGPTRNAPIGTHSAVGTP